MDIEDRIKEEAKLEEIMAWVDFLNDLHKERSHARLRYELNALRRHISNLILDGYITTRRRD